MCENVVEVSEHCRCPLEQKSPLDAPAEPQLKKKNRTGARASNSTGRAVHAGDLQNTPDAHPDRPGPGEAAPAATADVWGFMTFHGAFPAVRSAPGSWKCLCR